MKNKSYIIGQFKEVGVNTVDTNKVVQDWNNLFWIMQYEDKYRLIKYKKLNSPVCEIKTTISDKQAKELMKRLGLSKTQSLVFRHAYYWRK